MRASGSSEKTIEAKVLLREMEDMAVKRRTVHAKFLQETKHQEEKFSEDTASKIEAHKLAVNQITENVKSQGLHLDGRCEEAMQSTEGFIQDFQIVPRSGNTPTKPTPLARPEIRRTAPNEELREFYHRRNEGEEVSTPQGPTISESPRKKGYEFTPAAREEQDKEGKSTAIPRPHVKTKDIRNDP